MVEYVLWFHIAAVVVSSVGVALVSVQVVKTEHRISSINTAFLISTPMQYYSNTNNIEIVVIFISNAPSNSTACHFMTLDIIAKYYVTMAVSSIVFRVIMSSYKERGKMY